MENNRKPHLSARPRDTAGKEWQDSYPKKLFYKIGEVCEIADIPPHVLRYWETEFPSLKPVKNSAGQRVYRPKDIDLILTIRRLLYEEGFTISGARKKIREGLARPPEPARPAPAPKAAPPPPASGPTGPAGLGSQAGHQGPVAMGVTLFPDTRIVGEIRAELQQILEQLEKKPGS